MPRNSRTTYYADFVLGPLLVAVALWFGGLQPWAWVLGLCLWTYAEYWIHRRLLHRTYRREHWRHHLRPEAFDDTVPALASAGIQWFLLLTAWAAGPFGLGVFAGIEAGYLAYIATHDRIHHGPRRSRWVRARAAVHDMHHAGVEANFGVVTNIVDRLHGTYRSPL
jgi:sterol desaturase/sphingolipid hydroxylase (fatty acid hydroxylase superfamily)